MPRYPCPVGKDPNAYPVWIDKVPPTGCPHDAAWQGGGDPVIRNVTECRVQMERARQAVYFRKLAPEAFDETGKMRPDGWGILGPRLPRDYVIE